MSLPLPGALLSLLLGANAHAALWTDPDGRFTLELADGWTVRTDAPPLIEGEVLRARNDALSAGFAVREWDREQMQKVKGRAARKIDVDATLSADRFALAVQRSHTIEEVGPTLFVGPADGVSAALGRWVYAPPQAEGEPRWVWWQVIWRTPEHYHQLVAWAPLDQLPAFAAAMRALEAGVVVADASSTPATLLWDSGRDDCGVELAVDRATVIRQSRRFNDARDALRGAYDTYRAAPPAGGPDPVVALTMGELKATGVLYHKAEDCVHQQARLRRECTVREGMPVGPSSRAFQEGVARCLDEDADFGADLDEALGYFLPAPTP